jgi:hypothetical protein
MAENISRRRKPSGGRPAVRPSIGSPRGGATLAFSPPNDLAETPPKEIAMASRQMKMPEKIESEPEEHFSQRKRPELGRYLLQVDRQTKNSYQTVETAELAALAIKKDYPILHVTIYDSVECASTVVAPPPAS